MRKRDIGILIVSLLGILISFQQTRVSVYRGFFIPYRDEESARHVIPPVLVTDLNGDGTIELVTVSTHEILGVYSAQHIVGQRDFYEIAADKITYLTSSAIGVGVGYLKPYKAGSTAPRTQTVVTVTDDYVVSAFDHNLILKWSARIPTESNFFTPKHAAVTIQPHNIYSDDEGVVIVGVDTEDVVRLAQHTDDLAGARDAAHFGYYAFSGGSGELRWSHDAASFHRDSPDSLKSLKAGSYKLRAQQITQHRGEEDWHTFRAYFNHALRMHPHCYSHVHHSVFTPSFFSRKLAKGIGRKSAKERSQAKLHANVTGSAKAKGRGKFWDVASRQGVQGDGLALPHDESEHMKHPNVVIVNRHDGVEAIHLFSGRTVSEIGPLKRGVLYSDVNGDGYPDNVEVRVHVRGDSSYGRHRQYDGEEKDITECKVVILSGLAGHADFHDRTAATSAEQSVAYPQASRVPIWQGNICLHSSNLLHKLSFLKTAMELDTASSEAIDTLSSYWGKDHSAHAVASGTTLAAAPPVLIHLVGGRRAPDGSVVKRHEAVVSVIISSGLVTSIAPRRGTSQGAILWQTSTPAIFDPEVMNAHLHGTGAQASASAAGRRGSAAARGQGLRHDAAEADRRSYPQLVPYHSAAVRHGKASKGAHKHERQQVAAATDTDYLIAVGDDIMVFLAAHDGTIVAEERLLATPIAPLIIADVNGDGTNDIMVPTRRGIVGYIVVTHVGASVAVLLVGLCLCCLVALFFSQTRMLAELDPFSKPSVTNMISRQKRSTD